MRQHHAEFRARGIELVAVAPDGPRSVARYWAREELPFPAVADPEHRLAALFGQEAKLLRLGRLPAAVAVDAAGVVRAAWYGDSMRDVPEPEALLAALGETAG